jgi:hypothetical protein
LSLPALVLLIAVAPPASAQVGLLPSRLEAFLAGWDAATGAPVAAAVPPEVAGEAPAPVAPGVPGEGLLASASQPGLLSRGYPLPEWGQEPRLGARLGLDALVSGGAHALPDSLPDGMPFYTGLLWGEHGLVRAVGLAPSTRRGELVLRRSMLQWHQRMGLATLGVMTAQVILGELIAADRVEHSDLIPTHRTLGYVTFGMYLGTASLSLGAPPARRYGGGFSNVQLHRYLALVHFTGMMAQPWLGQHIGGATSLESYESRLRTHQWVGRITYTAFLAAILSIFLGT